MTSHPRPESIIKWWPMLTDETRAEIKAYADACVSKLTKELGECSGALEAAGQPIEWQAKIDAVTAERDALRNLLEEVYTSGISYTNEGRYHEVQISLPLWGAINAARKA